MLKPCLRRLGALLLAFFVCLPAVCPAAAAEPAAAAVDVYREEEGRQLEEKAPADFSFQVPAAGRYQLQIEYKAPEGKPITPQGSLEILQNQGNGGGIPAAVGKRRRTAGERPL